MTEEVSREGDRILTSYETYFSFFFLSRHSLKLPYRLDAIHITITLVRVTISI